MQPYPNMLSETLRWFPQQSAGVGDLWVVMIEIEIPHPLHTHIRSSLDIYNEIQHLLPWSMASGHKDVAQYLLPGN